MICIFSVCIWLGMLQPIKSQDFVVVKEKPNKNGLKSNAASTAATSNHAGRGNAAPISVTSNKHAPESESSDLASAIDAVLLASAVEGPSVVNTTETTNFAFQLHPTVDKVASTQIRHLLRKFSTDKLLRQIFHLDKKKRRKSRIRRDAEAEAVAAEAKPQQDDDDEDDDDEDDDDDDVEEADGGLDQSVILLWVAMGLGLTTLVLLLISLSVWLYMRKKSPQSKSAKDANKSANYRPSGARPKKAAKRREAERESGRENGGKNRGESDDYKYRKLEKIRSESDAEGDDGSKDTNSGD